MNEKVKQRITYLLNNYIIKIFNEYISITYTFKNMIQLAKQSYLSKIRIDYTSTYHNIFNIYCYIIFMKKRYDDEYCSYLQKCNC